MLHESGTNYVNDAFHAHDRPGIYHIDDASALMREWLGPASAIIFGHALLAVGQSSTVTGTMVGRSSLRVV